MKIRIMTQLSLLAGAFVGKNIPTALSEQVAVNVKEIDGIDSIELIKLK